MTTGQLLFSLSGLQNGSALAHLMAITTGEEGRPSGANAGIPGFYMASKEKPPVIQYREVRVEVPVEVTVEKIIERVVDRIVEVPVEVTVHVPASIPGVPEGEAPRIEIIDGVPLLEVSKPLIEASRQIIVAREADNTRLESENARLAGEVEALTTLIAAVMA